MQRVARGMIRFRLPMLIGCLAVTALLYPSSQDIGYDRSVRSLFSERNPRLATYYQVQEDFGGEALCLAVYTDPDLLTSAGMVRLSNFTSKLRAVPGVLSAKSLADLPRPTAAYRMSRTLRDWFQSPATDAHALRDEILACEMYTNLVVGSDGRTAAVVLEVDLREMASGGFTGTLAELRRIAAENSSPATIVGTPVLINDVYDFLEQDSRTLATVSTLAVLLVVLVLLRNLRWVLLPMMIVQVTLIWTRAYMAIQDIQLSIIGSMTTALVTVIGIATVIHAAVRYREEFDRDGDSTVALERTLCRVGPAVFWTCATTAVGFGALAISQVEPVRNYGQVMALASLGVGLASFLLVPGGVLIGSYHRSPRSAPGERLLAAGLDEMAGAVSRHGLLVAVTSLSLLVTAAVGLKWLKVETDFTRNFRAGSQILEGYRFVEDRLGGAGTIDLVFDTPENLTPQFLDRVRECERQLRQLPGVTKVTGLTDLLDFVDESIPVPTGMLSGLIARTGVFDIRPGILTLKLAALRQLQPGTLKKLWNAPRRRMRLQLRAREQQTVQGKSALLESIERTAGQMLGDSARVSGLHVMLVYLIDNLLSDQWLTLAVSAVGTLVMLTVAFRSPRLGIVAFLPNLVPIIVVLGLMGWLGLKINVATAMIGSISMGLVVDFSIHYLSRLRQEQAAGADFETALARTHRSTGKAMVFANLALMLGFGVLIFSRFVPTMHFGLLVSIAMLGGLLGNLLLLPVLLRLVFPARTGPR